MARIESSGHLTFHLDKLKGLVAINTEGNYALTDDGREALRLVSNLATNRCNNDNRDGKNGNNAALAVLGILLVASVVIAATAVMGTQITMNNVNHLNREMFDNLWIDTINAKQHMQSAISAIEAGQFDAATIELSKAEVYARRIGSEMPVPMGAELSTFYDYVRPNLRTLTDRLGAVELRCKWQRDRRSD